MIFIFFCEAVYYVTERCQDGWFKGANRSQKTGVFPGNYVAPLRNNRETNQMLNLKRQGGHALVAHQHNPTSHQHGRHSYSHDQTNVTKTPTVPPPELPPRSNTTSSGSVWAKPLGQHVESFFNRKSASNNTSTTSGKLDISCIQIAMI